MTTITSHPFFETGLGRATLYTLKNAGGMEADIADFGGIIYAVRTEDRNGRFADVALGYGDYQFYKARTTFFGAMIGRFCNRIGKGRFTLNGKDYQLALNDKGKNHLHGGNSGLDGKLFQAEIVKGATGDELHLRTSMADGEENYPGNLSVEIRCTLSDANELTLHYTAQSDADTLCNLTNHSYFNLAGHDAGSILDHELKLYASYFTEADTESIPTGRVLPVAGTPMDFLEFHKVGERIDADYEPLHNGKGYDHNWVLDHGKEEISLCAELYEPESGRLLRCFTDCPCMQVYSGNFINPSETGKDGVHYQPRAGIALETQYAPDAVNHPDWDSPILRAGEKFDRTTVFQFGVK